MLARHLTPGVEPDAERFGWACLCVAECAIGIGCAPEMGRSFIYAVARITGLNSYVRMLVGAAKPESRANRSGVVEARAA